MNKIGKTGLINRLDVLGYNVPETKRVLDDLFNIIAEELCKQNSVAITNVVTLVPSIGKPTTKIVAGTSRDIPERIKVKAVVSSKLREKFSEEYSNKARVSNRIRGFGDNLLEKF